MPYCEARAKFVAASGITTQAMISNEVASRRIGESARVREFAIHAF
jgi:hypothetical protein